jgi:type VI secretion system secreted protein Hcp
MPMPINMWVTVGGNKIEGDCDIAEREGSMLVYRLDHEINIPTETDTGRAVGKRVHGPLTVVKPVDQGSPLLYQALCQGKDVEVVIKWYRIDAEGVEEHYFTTELQKAKIVSLKEYFPETFDKSKGNVPHLEKVGFRYDAIVWTHEAEGKSTQDSWAGGEA